jgi:glycosyltransferase involved in cell wall biosynthesis
MSKISKISVVIPCYNEENTISQVIIKVEKSLLNLNIDYEIIVVDDHSTDDSSNKLIEFENQKKIKLFTHSQNFGKGAAIATGLKNISGEIILIQDADLEYDPDDYKKLILPFYEANADVVYGSRFLGGGKYVRIHFFWHYVANKILTLLCNMIANLNLTDMETGYKLFRYEKIKYLKIKEKSFGFEPEITIKLAKKKSKFFEVPISYNGRSYKEGKKIGLKDAFVAVYCIFKYALKN